MPRRVEEHFRALIQGKIFEGVAKPIVTEAVMSVETPRDRFLRFCPGGFTDPSFLRLERDYKWAAHETWCELLNEPEFDRLLTEENYEEICRRAVKIEGKTKFMLTRYEKAALHDGVKGEKPAKLFANGLYDLVYGKDDFETRFQEFAKDLEHLPERQTSPVKWTIITMFPFLADPAKHMFLKPQVTKLAAKRRHFSLNYRPELSWLTYSCLLRFADVLWQEVADLKPRDMLDIQSYIWVTESWKRTP